MLQVNCVRWCNDGIVNERPCAQSLAALVSGVFALLVQAPGAGRRPLRRAQCKPIHRGPSALSTPLRPVARLKWLPASLGKSSPKPGDSRSSWIHARARPVLSGLKSLRAPHRMAIRCCWDRARQWSLRRWCRRTCRTIRSATSRR